MRMQPWFPVVILLATFLAVVVGLVLIAQFLIGPVNRARTRLQAPTQFMLTDVFWLMILLQESLAFTTQFVPRDQTWSFGLILGFLCFATFGIWAGGVNFMSQAGIRHIAHRALFQLVLLPGALLAMIGLPAVIIITIQEVLQDDINWLDPTRPLYISWGCLLGGSAFLRWLSLWLARRALAQWESAKDETANLSAG